MGEVDTSAAPPPPMIDLTAVEVDPSIGERFYRAVIIRSKQGTTYRMVAKTLPDGRLDLVHFVCDLDVNGTMFGKRRVRRIESQPVTRFEAEIETIKKDITASGEEVQGVWEHDLMNIQDVAEQVSSLDAWMVTTAKEIVPA
ncbi:hypothetical protein [Nitrospira sp. M1]